MNFFEELSRVDVGEHIESKGQFSYLSWSWAVQELCKRFPKASWEIKRFPLPECPEMKVPYMHTPLGYFVEVEVTVDGVSRGQIHPVLDNRNQPIKSPNPFQINTSIQRALVKAIAVATGLGLYIYQGEDLPPDMGFSKQELDGFKKAVETKQFLRLYKLSLDDQEKYIKLHGAYLSGAPQGEKGKWRSALDDGLKAAAEEIKGYADHILENPDDGSLEELSPIERDLVERILPMEQAA